MTPPGSHGTDPVDGLRLALLHKRADEIRSQLQWHTFGMKEALAAFILACGATILALAGPGQSRTLALVLGWAMILQACGLYFGLRYAAAKELRGLEKRITAMTDSPDGKAMAEAAGAARSLLLGK